MDDSESSRYTLTRHLRRAGYAVVEASTTAEAYEAIAAAAPELIVLDIALPDGNGMEFCRELRAHPATASLPVVQISAQFTRGEDYARGLDSGADTYLFQPIEPTVLLASVRSLLRARKAEAARARLAAIVENADEPIISKDLNGVITSWNSAAERIFGYSAKEAVGQSMTLIIPAELRDQERDFLERLAQGERIEQLDTVRVAKDGRRIDVQLTISPIRDEAGRIVGASKIIHDITRRKKAEEALRASETRLKTILENLHEGLIVVVPEGAALHWNRMALEMHGYTSQEQELSDFSKAMQLYEITTLEGQAVPLEQWPVPRLLREGSLRDYELIVRHKHRSWERVLSYGGVVLPSTGNIALLGLLTIRDVTERKQAERALVESEERFRTLADNISQFAWMADQSGSIFWYNKRWFEYTGTTLKGVRGWGWKKVHHPEHVERVERTFRACVETGQPWEDTFPLRAKDGTYRWFLSRALPIRDAKGRTALWFGTNTDITEQRDAEEKLERLVAERTVKLQETVGDLEHFSYTLTHDMRAPLRAMQAFGQLLEREYANRLDDLGQDYLRRIVESSRRMDHLITDALSYTKVVRQQLELKPVDTQALLKGMLKSYSEFQPPKAEVRIEEGIPWVLGNPAGLTQCFSNLLANAVKFVKPGAHPQVRVWAERRDGWVRVWVEDNGIGIRREDQDKLFTMFMRLTGDYEGTGIGLALVRKVAERMRGRVGVESEPGKGSRFWLELRESGREEAGGGKQ